MSPFGAIVKAILYLYYKINTHTSAFLIENSLRRLLKTSAAIPNINTVRAMMNTTATTPPIMAAVLSVEFWEVEAVVAAVVEPSLVVILLVVVSMSGGCVGIVVVLSLLVILLAVVSGGCVVVMEHSPSLRDEMATEHSASTVISTPVTMIVAPPLTQLSSREMREPMSVSELPPSLARNVTCVGDSE